jgi:hypothetical protein
MYLVLLKAWSRDACMKCESTDVATPASILTTEKPMLCDNLSGAAPATFFWQHGQNPPAKLV